jgi:hypothetical protein
LWNSPPSVPKLAPRSGLKNSKHLDSGCNPQ